MACCPPAISRCSSPLLSASADAFSSGDVVAGVQPWNKAPIPTTGADNTVVSEDGLVMLNPKVPKKQRPVRKSPLATKNLLEDTGGLRRPPP